MVGESLTNNNTEILDKFRIIHLDLENRLYYNIGIVGY
jgi:hypothetical protein